MQMEHMTRRSCRGDGAARRDTLLLLPSRWRCPTRKNCVNRMPMERMVRRSCQTRRSCPTRQSCPTRMGSVVSPPDIRSGEVQFSEPYEEVDVVGQRKSLAFIPVTLHRDPLPCATVKVPHFYFATFQGRANTHAAIAGLIYLFFSVPVFTTGLVTVICPSPPLFGLFVFFSSPWSRDISFFPRVYYSCLFSQTVCTVLLSQYSLHEPVLWTSSLSSPEYFSIPSDWCRVPNI